jgi:uncharacterized protein YecE (DUF72 family)
MIRVGPAGWAYKDWNGIVYPKPRPRGFDPLRYLAVYFDAIEINSSYYGPPRPSAARQWVESVAINRAFRFTAKLFHSFTHERKPAPTDERDFKDGIAPLMEAGLFGALLLQFPWSFKDTPENREYLVHLCRRFAEYPLVLEVRHASWNDPQILDFLEDLEIGLCNIDQPLFKRSIRPGAEVTSSVGYVRLHGRNYKNWFSEKADVRERYDYLYPPDELDPWIDRIRVIDGRARDTYIMSNNHNVGKAATNALQVMSILKGEPVLAPKLLVRHYSSELAGFVKVDEHDDSMPGLISE